MSELTTPGAAFERLTGIIARLRGPDGCPWDREQTHASLRAHLLEECYEILDAIEAGDDLNLAEELGDLMMQPVLHCQIAAEAGRFDIVRVLEAVCDKLVRRHPHVFGDVVVNDAGEVVRNWDAIKRAEKAGRGDHTDAPASVLDGVPRALPALAAALKVSKKAARVGFEWPDVGAVLDKLREELSELEADLGDRQRAAEELGDLLFTAVNVARWQKIDPELALRETVARFTTRFKAMEQSAALRGQNLRDLSPEQWERLWSEAKAEERKCP